MTKEEKKEYMKKYYESHKEKMKERAKKYNEKNNDKILERKRKYRENNHEQVELANWVSKYFSYFYSRYISLKNYLTIMKLEDVLLKRSIMIKLGHGAILEDEAVALSGMVWTEEDQKRLDGYLKNRKSRKQSSSKS